MTFPPFPLPRDGGIFVDSQNAARIILSRPENTFMKRKFPFQAAVAAALLCLLAFPSCSDEPQSRVAVIQSATKILSDVRDKESADAAADRVAALLDSIEKFAETPDADASKAELAVGQFVSQGMRLDEQNYYESERLKKVLRGKYE